MSRLCVLSISVVLIPVLVLERFHILLPFLFPLLMVMMFLSTRQRMKRPVAFFDQVLYATPLRVPSRHFPLLLVLLLLLLVPIRLLLSGLGRVVAGVVVDHLVEMRQFQNRTLERITSQRLES